MTSSVQSDSGATATDTALVGDDATDASTAADADKTLDNATTSDATSPSRVLVVASDVADAQGLADDVNADTVCVVYDASTATTSDVLDMVSQALDGTKAQSIAFATNGPGAGQMELTKDLTISLDTLDNDQNLQDFWQSIGSMVESDGRIDILACDAGAGTEGAAMASAISDLSGVDVAASVNTTGDADSGGDWTLETRNVDVATLYFDTTKLNTYTGTLDSAATAVIAGSATTAPTSASSGAVRVMAVSSAVANARTLASDVADGVIALVYDAADTAEHVLRLITQALNGQRAESIAFASHENVAGSFDLVDGQIVNLGAVMTDDSQQDFWRGVGDLLTRDGSIDILACDQGSVTEGQLTVAAIAKASGHEAHASTDATGNETSGGDWVLELGDVDLTRTYFNAEKLTNYGGVLGTSLELTASDGAAGDEFGFGVAIDGDTIVVGARGRDSGAVYIYYNDGSSWTFQAELPPTDGGSYDCFGQTVAIDGDTVVVGSLGYNRYTGAAYVYTRSATTWTLEQELTASDKVSAARFGTSVDIDGDTIIVGAHGKNTFQGAAYVFVRSGSTWTETAELTASDGRDSDYFGASVAIDGDTIVVGAYQHAVDDHTTQGAAYVFVGSGSTWTQQAELTSDDGAAGDNFGIGVAINGDTVVVGAYCHNVGDASNQGEAYVYTRTSETWSQQAKLTASDGKADASFGYSVAIDGEYVMVGAKGMNIRKGAAYLYKRDAASSWIQIQELTSSVTASLGNSVAISGHVIIAGAPRLTIGDNSKVGALYVDDIPVTGITLDGAEADQALNDTGTIQPFAHFTIDDSSGDTTEQNLTVSLSSTANGGFTTLSGFTDNHDGTYSFAGTAAQAQTAIRGLVFTPTAHQVAPGLTVTTTFTVSDSDGTFSSSNNATTVVATSLRDTPTFTGALADQAVNDDATVTPFSGFAIVDPDIGETHTVTVTLNDKANGALSNLGSGAYDAATGVYTVSGTLAQVNAAMQGLVFTPTAHQVAPGQTVTTTFTVTDTAADAHGSSSATPNSVTTVVATSVRDTPSFTGATADQAVNDNATLSPFSGFSIVDPDPGETHTVTVTLSDKANGALSSLGSGSYDADTGVYTVSGTLAQVNAAVQGLVFTPTAHQVAPGLTVTTTFTVADRATDANGSITGSNNNTTVVATSLRDTPAFSGAQANQAVEDDAALWPFSGFAISDPDPGQTHTVTVTLSDKANGALSNRGGGSYDADTGVYTVSGTLTQVNDAIQGLVFTPTDHQVAPGLTVTTTFTVTDTAADARGSSSATPDDATTVVATSLRDTPTFTGAVADQAVNDDATVTPFSGFSIVDPDIGQIHSVTVTLSDPANGTLSSELGGGYFADTGVYAASGTLAQVNAAIQSLVFTPTAHQVASGLTVTTTFTVTDTAADARGSSSATPNDTTTVVATAMALPTPSGGGSGGGGGGGSHEPAASPPASRPQAPTSSDPPVVTEPAQTGGATSTTPTGVVNNASTASGLTGTGLPSADSNVGQVGGNANQTATSPGQSQTQQLAPTGVADTSSYTATSDQTLTIAPSGTVRHSASVTAGTLGASLPLLTGDAGLGGFGGLGSSGGFGDFGGSANSGGFGGARLSGQTGAGQGLRATGPAQSGLAPAGTSGATTDSTVASLIDRTATALGGTDQARTSQIKNAMTDVVQTVSDVIGSQVDQASALAEIERSVAEAAADKGVTDPAVIEGMRAAAMAMYQQMREGGSR